MTDRRDLLKLIGLGAAGSSAGCTRLAEEARDVLDGEEADEESEATDEPGSSGSASQLSRTLSQAPTDVSGAPRPRYRFDYGEREVSVEDSDTFREVRARSATTRPGDRMRVVPSGRTPAELRGLLETVWGISDRSTEVETTVDGETVTFEGSAGPQVTALTAVTDEAVLVARGEDLETVESLADRWPEGL